MKINSRFALILLSLVTLVGLGRVQAQLAITEVMSSASTNLGPNLVTQNSDFWELTNFGTNTLSLTGYKFDDSDNNLAAADPTPFEGLSVGPGESILFVQNNVNTNEAGFRDWWGTNLPAGIKVVFYSGNGLSSGGDGIRLWGPNALDAADVVDSVDFGEARRGFTFSYDPATGDFGILSTNGVNGAFQAAAADDVGSPGKTSGPTTLAILQHPADVIVNPGDPLTLTVMVRGRPRGTYQWFFKDSPIAGATNATLQIQNAQASSSGPYHVTVENGVQTVTSTTAQVVLQAEVTAPVFTKTPTDLALYVGQGATFSAAATGVPQPSFQWQRNGQDIGGANSSDFVLANASEQDAGTYAVIARNAIGAVTNTFSVIITPKPQLVLTEIMSSSSTNVAEHADWWELTNLGTFPISLKGFRFDDNSETLAAAFTFTNDVSIAENESVIFVEGLTPEEFRNWWGPENLLPNLQVITYRGNGLSSAGDAVNVWNAAATDDADKLASAVFSTATMGITFGYNSDAGQFGEPSIAGQFGAFAASSGGDIGSPGYIRDSQRVFLPRFREIKITGGNILVTWSGQPGTKYVLQAKTGLEDAAWGAIRTVTATETLTTVEEPISGATGQRFFRVVSEP
ncbi:MAG: immunoglobulin domain-containing protein [Verrucomicrobiales bacterium]|nr:immunoglobulin domain-containing protein [Verrucomicrobiales bacterium]